MSDHRRSDEPTAKTDETTIDRRTVLANNPVDDASRRSLLQYGTAVGSAVLGLGGLSSSAAANTGGRDPEDLAVEGTTAVASTLATREYAQARSGSVVAELGDEIADRHDLEHRSDHALEVTTNDPELNRGTPRVVFSGYGPRADARGAGAPDRAAGGVVVTMTADVADANGRTDRRPVTAFAATTESPPGVGPADVGNGNQDLLRKMYSVDDAGRVAVERVDRTTTPDVAPTGASGDVTTQGDGIDAICASGCTAIVGAICDRATGTVSKYLCVKVCTPLISSLYGYAACAAGCVILVDVINNKGCYVGAAGICAEVC